MSVVSDDDSVEVGSTMNITPSDRAMDLQVASGKGVSASLRVSQPSGLQLEKTVTVTENGETVVTPDDGKLALGSVKVIADVAASAGGFPVYTLVSGTRNAEADPEPGWYNSEGVKLSTEEVTAMLDSLTAFTESREYIRPLIYQWSFEHETWPVNMGLGVFPPTLCIKVVNAPAIVASEFPESYRIGDDYYIRGLGLYFLATVSSTQDNYLYPLHLYKTAVGYIDPSGIIDPAIFKSNQLPCLNFAVPERKLYVDASRLAVGVSISDITCLSTGESMRSFIIEWRKGYPVYVGTGWYSDGRLSYPSETITWARKSSSSASYPDSVGFKYVSDDGIVHTVLIDSNSKVSSITTSDL